ncbi:RHS repeat-associated core domain-containing protein [Paraflavitalea speifideaquila]|uniref:RHS repeat domain-containing protein n=1 Tax=Paraflavitalea speifideaquila TaxID=3076558 RepID=UPI0028EB6628|nr:RHS repeat-associated core domain-containing protein [Paraflavitalea speifideiaquila]
MTKNGFLYIYVSNETQNWDVFFDNLSVQHITGPIMEETHYYPFGLTMAGISSKALKSNYTENKYKYNGIEQNTDFDLSMYDAFYRNLDPQIGRWWQVDPETEDMEMWSPYVSNYNNPLLYSDPQGDFPILIPIIAYAIAVGEAAATTGLVVTTTVVAANAAQKHYNANAGTVNGSYISGSPLGLTTGEAYQKLHAPAVQKGNSIEKVTLYQPKDVVVVKAKGTSNPTVKKSKEIGQEAHRQIQKEIKDKDPGAQIEKKMELKDGTVVRKDAVESDGTPVIIKPDTKTGRTSAQKREKLLLNNGEKQPKTMLYDPKNPAYLPQSPTYIGPKKQ